jgi:hypothetical protein
LVPTPIPKTPMHPIKTYSSRTYMPIEISSYKEFHVERPKEKKITK